MRLEPLIAKQYMMKGCEKSRQSLLDGKMTKLGQMLVDDGYKRGKIQGALLCGKTPEEVAEMFDILLQEVLKVKENEKDMKKA